ncbi:MAG TPA: leucine-rich repeat domain-containing protein [Verrucomicrobiales bacterium]|nr:leucine-rich repeat domain-containing protein [Verrucomicrobiales bacterium]
MKTFDRFMVLALLLGSSWWLGLRPASAQEEAQAEEKPVEEKKAEPVFLDKNLEKAVRKFVFAKRDNEEPLVEEDVLTLSTIKGEKMGIKDLTGLEKCRALASLELAGNEISDAGPLKELTEIQLLDLAENQIEDLHPLAGIKAIQFLDVSKNRVKSLEPLRALERLTSFYASENQVEDLSPLFGLPRVTSLHAQNNRITGIAGINSLKRLSSLGLSGNQIEDLAPLQGLTNLTGFLFLENNRVSDLGPLLEMCRTDLEGDKRFAPYVNIYLSGNPLDSESSQDQLRQMKELGLRLREREGASDS